MARGSKSNGHGEEILLMLEHVRHQNQKGSLYVTSQNLAFQMPGKDNFDVTYHYSDIKTQKISAEGKSKVQLQILLHNDESFNFHFINPKGQSDQVKDRNTVKEFLMQLLPKFKKKINKDVEDKTRILRENPRLYQLYKDLVVNGLMTADEFWTQNVDKLRTQSTTLGQETGISAAFLKDIVPQVDGTNSTRYNLTPEVIQSIFKIYPAVKKRHADLVPDQLTEQDFWTRFFQSHYFHRERAVDRSAENIFGDSAMLEEKEMVEAARKGLDDPLANIRGLKDAAMEEEEGFGTNLFPSDSADASTSRGTKRSLNITNAQLIQRFNHHSTRILSSIERRTITPMIFGIDSQPNTPTDSVADESKDDIVVLPRRVSVPYRVDNEDDIIPRGSGANHVSLRLKKTDRYHQAPAKKRSAVTDVRRIEKRHEALKAHVRDFTNKRQVVISSKIAMQALHDAVSGKARRQGGTESHLPESLREEVRSVYASLAEILRHYWSCYPPTDKFLAEKLLRMKKTIEKFQVERLKPLALRAESEGHSTQLLAPLYEMVKSADLRFANQAKRGTS